MKNSIACLIAVALVAASSAIAGLEVTARGSFSASGEAAAVAIPARSGSSIRDVSLSAGGLVTNQNLTVSRPHVDTKAAAAVAASTTVTVYASSSNNIAGFTPTTSDFLLVRDTGSNGYQLRQLTAVNGAYTSATKVMSYTVDSAVTCASGSPVYVVDATNNMLIPLTTTSESIPYKWMFTGFRGMPVHLGVVTGSGAATVISGTYDVER